MKTLTLNNGVTIPSVGFGTWQLPNGDVTVNAVKQAIEYGYRHIDTATAYENEESVGKAMAESKVARKDLFVTAKLWNTDRGYDKTLRAFDESLRKLNLDYVDLYLIHWPDVTKDGASTNRETWKAFERLYKDGKTRSIGVCNFWEHHLSDLLQGANVPPMVNQIEFHPGVHQEKLVKLCQENKIVVEGWSPLGSGGILQNETLKNIAETYGRTVAQICLRWVIQHEVLPLPKSVTPPRIKDNLLVFDFELSEKDMRTIDNLKNIGGPSLNPDSIDF